MPIKTTNARYLLIDDNVILYITAILKYSLFLFGKKGTGCKIV